MPQVTTQLVLAGLAQLVAVLLFVGHLFALAPGPAITLERLPEIVHRYSGWMRHHPIATMSYVRWKLSADARRGAVIDRCIAEKHDQVGGRQLRSEELADCDRPMDRWPVSDLDAALIGAAFGALMVVALMAWGL